MSVGLAFIAPAILVVPALKIPTLIILVPGSCVFFLLLAALSFYFQKKKSSLLESANSLGALKAMTWKQFEWMVAEAYRRQGYTVEVALGSGPDGGVDLELRRDGRLSLVQCKRWKNHSVGAPVVRELYGILMDRKADEAIVVISGHFTREAKAFAQGKPITLIDGPALLQLVAGVQQGGAASLDEVPDHPQEPTPVCPRCGSAMVLRVARRGSNAGRSFYGCSTFPACKGVVGS